jgi:TonB family protein
MGGAVVTRLFSGAVLTVLFAGAAAAQTPPRDPTRQTQVAQDRALEPGLRALIAAHPDEPAPYLTLARLLEDRGALPDAEATLLEAKRAVPSSKEVLHALAAFYNRTGGFDKAIEMLKEIAALDPGDPAGHHVIATYYWEKASKDQTLSAEDKRRYAEAGIAAEDRALALNRDFVEALVYKNILLRMIANMETDPVRQRTLIAEADLLRARAMELPKPRQPAERATIGAPPPPPPPPPPGAESAMASGVAPVRVGGNITAPAKIKDVKPAYPPDAAAARVQGVVILEVTVASDGRVSDARVLRSIPQLDQAAIDAVRQWEFVPTHLNGAPVPVIMTVTVNFSLQ